MCFVEKALFIKLLLELLIFFKQLTEALLFNAVSIELIFAVTLIYAYLSGDNNAHALLQSEFQSPDPF